MRSYVAPPRICASTGSTRRRARGRSARISRIAAQRLPRRATSRAACLTFSPICAALGRLEVGEGAAQQRQQRDERSGASAASQPSSACQRPSWCRSSSPLPRSTPSHPGGGLRRGVAGERASRASRCKLGLVERALLQQQPAAARRAPARGRSSRSISRAQRGLPLARAARRRRAGPTLCCTCSMLATIAVGRVVVERGAGGRQPDDARARRARRAPAARRSALCRARRRSGRPAPSGGSASIRWRTSAETAACSLHARQHVLDRLRQLGQDRASSSAVSAGRSSRFSAACATCAVAARLDRVAPDARLDQRDGELGLPLERARPRGRCRLSDGCVRLAPGDAEQAQPVEQPGCARGRCRCADRGPAS